jgi:hypothetical protein
MVKPSSNCSGFYFSGRYRLRDTFFGLRVEKLMEHWSGEMKWVRVTDAPGLLIAMREIAKCPIP